MLLELGPDSAAGSGGDPPISGSERLSRVSNLNEKENINPSTQVEQYQQQVDGGYSRDPVYNQSAPQKYIHQYLPPYV